MCLTRRPLPVLALSTTHRFSPAQGPACTTHILQRLGKSPTSTGRKGSAHICMKAPTHDRQQSDLLPSGCAGPSADRTVSKGRAFERPCRGLEQIALIGGLAGGVRLEVGRHSGPDLLRRLGLEHRVRVRRLKPVDCHTLSHHRALGWLEELHRVGGLVGATQLCRRRGAKPARGSATAQLVRQFVVKARGGRAGG